LAPSSPPSVKEPAPSGEPFAPESPDLFTQEVKSAETLNTITNINAKSFLLFIN
jgi:hypothetical protein